MRRQDEGERDDQGRDKAVALPKVRSIGDSHDRQRRKGPESVSAMAVFQRIDRRPQSWQGDVLAKDRLDMEDMADSALHRRGARRRVPRRDPASQESRRAHSGRGRARRRRASLPDGMRHGMDRAHAQGPCSQDGVCDGSPGFAKAAAAVWPETRIQRCTFHVAAQVRRCSTLRPRLEAGIELLGIANKLADARDADGATAWLLEYSAWCVKWESFLREFTFKEGRRVYAHERLRKARRVPNKLVRDGTLFAFVEMGQGHGGAWPYTNNAVESVNARLRDMLRHHRGLPSLHRAKAIFWWCYAHTESPLPAAEILRVMPTDDDVEGLFAAVSSESKREDGAPDERGTGIVWEEFHMPTRYRQ